MHLAKKIRSISSGNQTCKTFHVKVEYNKNGLNFISKKQLYAISESKRQNASRLGETCLFNFFNRSQLFH